MPASDLIDEIPDETLRAVLRLIDARLETLERRSAVAVIERQRADGSVEVKRASTFDVKSALATFLACAAGVGIPVATIIASTS